MTTKAACATLAGVTIVAAAVAWGGKGGAVTKVNGTAWRNSLADALKESKRTGKPVLYLSMFGKLDEEMPCANARTLRATLFKDPEFSKFVQNEAIPAWEMVRPVPHVTIDFGDGKNVVRTVRGNAVMYLVNSDGKVFDAFPGVYTKDDFLPAVRESISKLAKADDAEVREYHQKNAAPIRRTLFTTSKLVLEGPTLRLMNAPAIKGFQPPVQTVADPSKTKFLREASRLADSSLTPATAQEAVGTAGASGKTPEELAQSILQRDSRLNMERTRNVVHFYFASEKKLPTPAEARDAVLGTILKIPYKDPTMGLSEVLLPGTPR
ncbi:hypothetical protein EON82_12665 [bacterium]|nr:MAG: hypothetical protein EON82_12665 [bacterium]